MSSGVRDFSTSLEMTRKRMVAVLAAASTEIKEGRFPKRALSSAVWKPPLLVA
jgi:hypothetical protein